MKARRKIQSKLLFAAFAAWVCVAAAGLAGMTRYSFEPGTAASSAPARFPADAGFSHDRDVPTLVMLAHPRCPCTRTSLAELSALMRRFPGRLKTYVLFYRPAAETEEWSQTELWQTAASIPGVTVIGDRDARGAALFGAYTSGQTLLYSTGGSLVFSGGITAGRGHEGRNAGRAAIEDYLQEGETRADSAFVFGCAIVGDETDPADSSR